MRKIAMTDRKWQIVAALTFMMLWTLIGLIEEPFAAEEVKTFQVQSAVSRLDKNGNPYVRFIVEETKTLNGTQYTVGVPVMAFGQIAKEAASYKTGDTVNAIVSSRDYQGRQSYTILAFVKKK